MTQYKDYYVNSRPRQGQQHEVHAEGCRWMPGGGAATALGRFTHCRPAVEKAKELYDDADGCATCCPDCHRK